PVNALPARCFFGRCADHDWLLVVWFCFWLQKLIATAAVRQALGASFKGRQKSARPLSARVRPVYAFRLNQCARHTSSHVKQGRQGAHQMRRKMAYEIPSYLVASRCRTALGACVMARSRAACRADGVGTSGPAL